MVDFFTDLVSCADMAKQDDYVRYTIRVPASLYSALQGAAGEKSINAEIINRLQNSLHRGGAGSFSIWLPSDVLARVLDQAERREEDPNVLILEAIEKAYPPPPTLAGTLEAMADKIAFRPGKRTEEEETFLSYVEEYIRKPKAAATPRPWGQKK